MMAYADDVAGQPFFLDGQPQRSPHKTNPDNRHPSKKFSSVKHNSPQYCHPRESGDPFPGFPLARE
jgi:hypothetical protein